MTTIKKRFLIAACALAFLSAGAFAWNTASAADIDTEGRDYHIALHEAEHPGDPLPPPEYRHHKKHKRFHDHWDKEEREFHHKRPPCVKEGDTTYRDRRNECRPKESYKKHHQKYHKDCPFGKEHGFCD